MNLPSTGRKLTEGFVLMDCQLANFKKSKQPIFIHPSLGKELLFFAAVEESPSDNIPNALQTVCSRDGRVLVAGHRDGSHNCLAAYIDLLA